MTEPKNAYFSMIFRKSMKIESIMMKFQGEAIRNLPGVPKSTCWKILVAKREQNFPEMTKSAFPQHFGRKTRSFFQNDEIFEFNFRVSDLI